VSARPPVPVTPKPKAADFFALRTPLLSADLANKLGEGLTATTAPVLGEALIADRRRVRATLNELVARPEVKEALYVASPSLIESLGDWTRDPDGERGQKVERALIRYLYRMISRSTPFGLFAGCTVGVVGEHTRLHVGELSEHKRHTRLDMDYLFALTRELGKDSALRDSLLFRPNSSLYRIAGELRYVESRSVDAARAYHLTSVEPTPYLEGTLLRAKDGATRAALAAPLVEDEVSADDAQQYIDELIDAQVLVSDLAPKVTGPEPIHDLIERLSGGPAESTAVVLRSVRDGLDALDRGPLGADPERYRALAKQLEVLPAPVEIARLFQIDMIKPSPTATLGKDVLAELLRSAELLHRIAPAPFDPMSDFRSAFTRRYESREVPLLEVLDEDGGIGFGTSADSIAAEASPLLRGIALVGSGGQSSVNVRSGEWVLHERLHAATRAGKFELSLDDDDLKAMGTPGAPSRLPTSMAMMATLLAESPDALAAGKFRIYPLMVGGPSAANLLGRFCHGDPDLLARVREHLRAEEAFDPDRIYAEIVHLPEGRVGNVILRPVLREYELAFLGRSGAASDRQILLSDLSVTIARGRVVLRSARLGKEIVPRLSNAHNYSARSLNVYRFLCTLAGQGVQRGLGFSWGTLDQRSFLPRVVHGRVVLERARWLLSSRQLKRLQDDATDKRYAAVQRLREELELPRWVAVEDSDNELLVDLDNVLSVESFVHLIARRGAATLVEPLGWLEGRCASGGAGTLAHELVLPLLIPPPAVAAASAPAPAPLAKQPIAPVVRSFAPGSEWLYVKLYAGRGAVDPLLVRLVRPVVDEALAAGVIDRWFFLRYGDPEWHLRLRFHGDPQRLAAELLPAIAAHGRELSEAGIYWRMQLDTYDREIERYGGPVGIDLFERYSFLDSEACTAIVEELSGDDAGDARWQLALRSMDMLLEEAGLDVPARLALIGPVAKSFRDEHNVRSYHERQIGDRYRSLRIELESLIGRSKDAESWLSLGLGALERRRERMRPLLAELRSAEAAGSLTSPVSEILPSYLHMLANRLLRGAARAQEMMLYTFLERLYEGQLARSKGKKK